ncbi:MULTISPECIES: hypothetical protein [Shewanella]|uniref:Uncharacterized protein n=1 Tax=Shewanella marisflavi TaxID=260364 RepID=A0ABX5WPB2_9GAMM|nr:MULTISPECIES: hypothetical protein [Shewanella]MCL1040372.1 hypothetical protein [Shewanella marisflavi]QDF76391.1 hypothetical protein FGA12_15170 [Shewanella marisflavi]
MFLEILALILAVILLLFLFKHRFTRVKVKRSRRSQPQPSNLSASVISEEVPHAPSVKHNTIHPYHCVEIVSDEGLCKNAEKLKGKRFLSDDAPPLPLAGCTKADCSCRYRHHEDRRGQTEDRRLDFGVTRELYGVFGETNRRHQPSKGRRQSDTRH